MFIYPIMITKYAALFVNLFIDILQCMYIQLTKMWYKDSSWNMKLRQHSVSGKYWLSWWWRDDVMMGRGMRCCGFQKRHDTEPLRSGEWSLPIKIVHFVRLLRFWESIQPFVSVSFGFLGRGFYLTANLPGLGQAQGHDVIGNRHAGYDFTLADTYTRGRFTLTLLACLRPNNSSMIRYFGMTCIPNPLSTKRNLFEKGTSATK